MSFLGEMDVTGSIPGWYMDISSICYSPCPLGAGHMVSNGPLGAEQ